MDHPHVIPNTSPGTGNAATSGPLSSFQTPVVAEQAVSSSLDSSLLGDLSPLPSFTSSNQHTPVIGAAGSSIQTCQMGHGQSKATPPLPHSLLPPQSSTENDPAVDAGLPAAKGHNVTGRKLKRPFGTKGKEPNDSYALAFKDTTGETIEVSKLSSPLSPSTTSSKYAPDSTVSLRSPLMLTAPPSSQVLDKNLDTSSSNPPPFSQPSVSSSGRPEQPINASSKTAGPSRIVSPSTLDPPATPGNRSSVIALSPGISSAINFMMMEWQEPSKPQLTVDTSSTVVSISPSLPSGVAELSKGNKDNDKSVRRHSSGSAPTSPDKREMKESWRKSDSTNSHHTVRANSLRASRPVSWAESFHSAYTIIPSNGSTASQGPSTRRLSGLIADVDFGVREEEPEEDDNPNVDHSLLSPSHHFAASNSNEDADNNGYSGTPTPDPETSFPARKTKDLLKKAKRRSISLSSAFPGPVSAFLQGAKTVRPEPPVTTTIPAPACFSTQQVREAPMLGMNSFRNVSQPHVHGHFRQQSENVLHQRPAVPAAVHHVPSIAYSTSQLTSGSSIQDTMLPRQSSAASSLRGKLQASLPPLLRNEQGAPVPPGSVNWPADVQTLPSAIATSNPSHVRQPAISGLGPSAAGMAKRAVERMSKRLGDMMNVLSSSSNSSFSGHSSSTSISTSGSTSVTSGTSLVPSPLLESNIQQSQAPAAGYVTGRTQLRGSNPASPQGSGHAHHHSMIHAFMPGPSKAGGHKRFQKSLGSPVVMGDVAIGGGSSSALSMVSTSVSTSESDPFSPTGPILGRCLRGPFKKGHVFGSELKSAVKDTKVVVKEDDYLVDEGSPSRKVGLIMALECRMLPAVVVRCAQHLLIWGVQEEGLFRVNGHPRHVSHLRAEFDSGADYDMTECSPSELDPHAVASVFKAYLRELPDSILTHKLQPYFDAAINKENTVQTYEQQSKAQKSATKIHGLPSGPRNSIALASLHKPPSLSTLAVPSFNQVPPPSRSLLHALRSLIAQLPPENRDLIRTVVDLITATAKGSKATKMPLSNLLLLFCPSLNMSPPLLRALCEAEGIWEEDPEDETDTRSGFDEEISLRSGRASSDNPSSLDYHASAEEDSLFSEERAALRRRDIRDRPEMPTVYLDTRSHLSSSSASLLQDVPEKGSDSFLIRQEMRDDGSISSGAYSFRNDNLPTSPSPPPLSSSAESVSTPTSSTNVSFSNLPLDDGKDSEQRNRSDADLPCVNVRVSPQIVGSEPGEIRKRPYISNPVPITGPVAAQYPFPTSRNKEQTHPPPSRRRSIPILSLSSLSSRSSGSPSASPSKNSPYQVETRAKRPSLKLLFSKKSSSSLLEEKERPVISLPLLQPPERHFQQERASPRSGSGSDSSISTPLSAVTAPQGSSLLCLPSSINEGPPVLNTLIEDSFLKFDDLVDPDKDPTKRMLDTPSSGLSPVSPPTSRSVSGGSVPQAPLSNLSPKPDTQVPPSKLHIGMKTGWRLS